MDLDEINKNIDAKFEKELEEVKGFVGTPQKGFYQISEANFDMLCKGFFIAGRSAIMDEVIKQHGKTNPS